jgi:hypothetical protein
MGCPTCRDGFWTCVREESDGSGNMVVYKQCESCGCCWTETTEIEITEQGEPQEDEED